MFTIITSIAVFVGAVYLFRENKIWKNWGRTLEVVADKIIKEDPVKKMASQNKATRLQMVKVRGSEIKLRASVKVFEEARDDANEVAGIAKKAGKKGDCQEAFVIAKEAELSIKSAEEDIEKNEEVYKSISKIVAQKETEITRITAVRERNKLRSVANSMRRDIAQDELLGQGVFSDDYNEECIEEIEAIATEKVNADLKGSNVIDKYLGDGKADAEFEKYFNEK